MKLGHEDTKHTKNPHPKKFFVPFVPSGLLVPC
jgi:hypothetical protein